MFGFNLLITSIMSTIMMFSAFKLNKIINLSDRIDEIIFTWFLAVALAIIARMFANMALHYEISSQVGKKGLEGLEGERGYNGESVKCY